MGIGSDIFGGIGDLIGGLEGSGDRNQALGYLQNGQRGFANLNPNITAQQTGPSNYLSVDPSGRAAQMDALAGLRNQISQGGLDAISKANLAQVQNQNNQMARTQQAGVMQAAQARGAGNSGNTLLGQLVAGQASANQNANAGLQVAGQQQQARQQAVGQLGQQGAQLTSQDYDRAGALDAINKFNAGQRQTAAQQTFGNSATQAGGEASAYGAMANQLNGNAQQTQKMWDGIGKSVGGVADAAGAAMSGGATDGASFG